MSPGYDPAMAHGGGAAESERIERVLRGSLAALGQGPDTVLQHLIAQQQVFSHVPEPAIDRLVAALGVTRAQILAAIDFYAFLHLTPRGRFDIRVSDNITDRMLGNAALMTQLCAALGVRPGEPRADGRVTVDFTSCTGMCDQGPAALVNGLALTRLDAGRIRDIAALVEAGTPLAHWPQGFFAVSNNVQRPGLLLADLEAREAGLARLFAQGGPAVLAEVERAGLRGRGGAGFTTALKWRFCREAPSEPGHPDKVIVCNADEGEPGTFKDRVLLTAYADLVFEGMTIAAGVVGASTGFLYLRGEYRCLLDHLEAVLARRRARGLLGTGIGAGAGPGGGFDFDIRVHLGAGAYICGEESALIESLEGKRGITRKRPPFPVTEGYLDRPTVVNNVETFLAAARIAEHGGYWFRSEGTDRSAGSKILSVSGDCARPGIYEVPFGTPVAEVLADCGARDTQCVQVSGAAGVTLTPDEFHRVLAFEDLPTAGSFMVFDRSRDLLEMVRNFAAFFAHESCGFCTPCRVGGRLVQDLVEKVAAGAAGSHDLDELHDIAQVLRRASHCGLGHTAANHVLNTLEKFPHIYRERLRRTDYTPSFDLDAALAEARALTHRDDAGSHLPADA
ncbi:NADH-ubiquinone oxidoreductase-F iron-sulfur binding region domain-containing protein [uncultured Thiohalocapsa sp.]|uniref:NADH-ubiquinone oxidoreductase-F iron-sulfur binding region domain-containing protein n=1 Tax=uncultured Thiohalocapsa sp. TaxID=768990 RepID=UPI0025DB7B4F|nr:NADH-ubiquinone oxidoreductase-F iron-sulfur binding region domain-containing protein [uncultured Thiohalocapsa sp.]